MRDLQGACVDGAEPVAPTCPGFGRGLVPGLVCQLLLPRLVGNSPALSHRSASPLIAKGFAAASATFSSRSAGAEPGRGFLAWCWIALQEFSSPGQIYRELAWGGGGVFAGERMRRSPALVVRGTLRAVRRLSPGALPPAGKA